jgi:uncharacterized protein (TIGR02147 family)
VKKSSILKEEVLIFEYKKFSEYFSAYLDLQNSIKKTFSYRQFCSRANIKSASMLTWLASGKRIPTPDLLERLNEVIGWKPNEYAYVHAMVNAEKAASLSEKEFFLNKMKSLYPQESSTIIEEQNVEMFKTWYTIAILEMTNLKDFSKDPTWISQKMNGKVTPSEVEASLKLLKDIGYLVEDKNGSLNMPQRNLRTKENIPMEVVRLWQVEMMRLAQQAVLIQEPGQRFFSGATLPFDSSKIKEAQDLLVEFRERFINLMSSGNPDQVYHFGMQFFRLTE